jgi:uncharacterized small protein (DUF1192 family)
MGKRWPFIKKQTNTASLQPVQPLQEATPLLSLYRSITELPLRNYIDGTVNGNLSAIIKHGVCTNEITLFSAWEDIKNQYAEIVGDESFKLYLSLLRQINKLSLLIDQIALCVEMLRLVYTDRFANELRNLLNVKFRFDVTDPEGYEKDLKSCISRSKGFKLQMDLKLAQYEAISKKEKGGQLADHAYYQSLLICISDHVGYPVLDSITVFEFATRIKRLNAEIERIEKERKK